MSAAEKSLLFFPGCTLQGMAADYGMSARQVFAALGSPLRDLPGWACCGSTSAHALDPFLAVAMAAANLAKVPADGGPLSVCCAACYNRLKSANHHLAASGAGEIKDRLRSELDITYDGSVPVRHLLEILAQDIGLERITASVKRDFSSLKVAPYYGCLLVRPPDVMNFDDPEEPVLMDQVLSAAGFTLVDWPFKVDCCGAGLTLARADIVARLVDKLLRGAEEAGADVIAVACPECRANLDMRQSDARKRYHHDRKIPILYFTQLLGLAFGIPNSDLGLSKAFNDPVPVIERRLAEVK